MEGISGFQGEMGMCRLKLFSDLLADLAEVIPVIV